MSQSWIDQADVINFGAIIALCMWVFLVIVGLYFATMTADPWVAYKDIIVWATPILLGILGAYGILKNKKEV